MSGTPESDFVKWVREKDPNPAGNGCFPLTILIIILILAGIAYCYWRYSNPRP